MSASGGTRSVRQIIKWHDVDRLRVAAVLTPQSGGFMAPIAAEVRARHEPKLKQLLTVEQFHRLQQINWQRQGTRALLEPDLAAALDIKPQQRERLGTLQQDYLKKVASNRPRGGETTKVQAVAVAKSAAAAAEFNQKALEVLEKAQQEKLEELKGKPFTFTAPSRRSLGIQKIEF